jgi:hypothetical protein
MRPVTSAWVLIAIGVFLLLAAMLVGPDYRLVKLLGVVGGGLLVIVGFRRRRAAARPDATAT